MPSLVAACTSLEKTAAARVVINLPEKLAVISAELDTLTVVLEDKITIKAVAPPQQSNHTVNVLIVDDDRSARLELEDALSRQGCQISHAENGEDALEACDEQKPDLSVLDAMMPIINGFATCSKLLELFPHHCPPIVMVSAHKTADIAARALSAGAIDFINKPIDLTFIQRRVASILKSSVKCQPPPRHPAA